MCPVKLRGRVAVVTGAGSGIGKVLATRLARDGASVVVADLKNYDVAAAEIAKSANARTLGLQVDVASEDDVARMAAETMKTFGRVDILVNNAAYFAPRLKTSFPPQTAGCRRRPPPARGGSPCRCRFPRR